MNLVAKENSMQTLHRGIQILKSFTHEQKILSLADLHRMTGLPKSTLQRILNTLVLEGFLEKDEKKKTYQLGMELLFLGQLVETNSNLLSLSLPVMTDINEKTGESVTLNVVHQNQRKCIGYLESKYELTTLTYVGHTSPLHAGASAKILLAHLPKEEQDKFLEQTTLEQYTDLTITEPGLLAKELQKIRQQGYAVSYGERVKGAFTVSAPIFTPFGELIAGLSLTIPSVRVEDEKMEGWIQLIKKGAEEISNRLKHKGNV